MGSWRNGCKEKQKGGGIKVEISVFKFKDNEIRVVFRNGQPWWVAKDVCDNLGINRSATRRLDDDEKTTVHLTQHGSNYSTDTTIVNESGLYALILGSRKLEAKQFKRWITHEVLPSIRKTGGYVANDDLFVSTYLPHLSETDRLLFRSTLETVRKQNELISEMKPKVDAYETLIDADGTQSLAEAAKALGYGRNTLTKLLREKSVLMTGTNHNIPYERFIKSGFFEVVEAVKYGKAYPVTRVTPKGLGFLERALRNEVEAS